MYFQCFVIYVLRGWYTFDRKVFLVSENFHHPPLHLYFRRSMIDSWFAHTELHE